mmetsp:Transcript_15051/g.22172  ORF Transcript_15051/g.22172 Transcript_15051/m.22172 type:complete len:620 (-) Transcript_15051:339-2198(-)|eukprot:CAMPEP_0195522146 /NCGR_PEP_ID=MMETSP0794_2-20130614/20069_1 /TAXON_ID=515487 /ORGANISM="Stephanopyxis turris, Strain CCMP 815" /LENGTH=619 /DNA_ID=CAMNT_0040651837 /DNA_START=92 /DNA_END=1951 /DNA_ORIENTATION=-
MFKNFIESRRYTTSSGSGFEIALEENFDNGSNVIGLPAANDEDSPSKESRGGRFRGMWIFKASSLKSQKSLNGKEKMKQPAVEATRTVDEEYDGDQVELKVTYLSPASEASSPAQGKLKRQRPIVMQGNDVADKCKYCITNAPSWKCVLLVGIFCVTIIVVVGLFTLKGNNTKVIQAGDDFYNKYKEKGKEEEEEQEDISAVFDTESNAKPPVDTEAEEKDEFTQLIMESLGGPLSDAEQRMMDVNKILTLVSGSDVLHGDTPQKHAANWILEIDGLALSLRGENKVPAKRLVQRYVMAVIYFSFRGEKWVLPEVDTALAVSNNSNENHAPWLSDVHECNWDTVFCYLGVNVVADITLSSTNLNGVIPMEISRLEYLKTLDLWQNEISGEIPSTIGALKYLTYLDLSENNLEGTLPDSLFQLTDMEFLYLGDNKLTGLLSSRIENFVGLVDLRFENNEITGEIPLEIKNLKNLHYFIASSNELSGAIPATIEHLTNLEYLDLSTNKMSGNLPKELFNLSQMGAFYLNDNRFTGNIPLGFENMPSLREFVIYNNIFDGDLPSDIGKAAQLETLLIYGNDFGKIPIDVSTLIKENNLVVEADCTVECESGENDCYTYCQEG